MYKKLFLILLFIPVLLNLTYSFDKVGASPKETKAIAQEESTPSANEQIVTIEAKQLDNRAVVLHDYLAKKNSPLQYHAQDFVDAADYYNMDWRLVAAISGVESNFGQRTPGGFNGWGWGVYGNQALGFKTWRDGIFTVSKGLKENYINKGLTDPYKMNRIYASSPVWGEHVAFFLSDIDAFAKEYNTVNVPTQTTQITPEAGNSAKLSLKLQ